MTEYTTRRQALKVYSTLITASSVGISGTAAGRHNNSETQLLISVVNNSTEAGEVAMHMNNYPTGHPVHSEVFELTGYNHPDQMGLDSAQRREAASKSLVGSEQLTGRILRFEVEFGGSSATETIGIPENAKKTGFVINVRLLPHGKVRIEPEYTCDF